MKIQYFFLILFSFVSASQTLPDTDILIYKFHKKNKEWKKIKTHTDSVYENQLFFINGKKYIFVKKDDVHTAVFYSSISGKRNKLMIKDTFSIFSPVYDVRSKHLRAVIQDRKERQWIVNFKPNKKNYLAGIIPGTDSAGYHTYSFSDTVVFYHVGKQHTLRILFPDSHVHIIGKNPLRSFYRINSFQILWGYKKNEKDVIIFLYDIRTQKNSEILHKSSVDYFTLTDKKEIVIIENQNLCFYTIQGNFLHQIFLPQEISTKKITRFYISPKNTYYAFIINKTE
jgi:hypothetical protein